MNVTKCDNCGRDWPTDQPGYHLEHQGMPDHTTVWSEAPSRRSLQNSWDFCSVECLDAWAVARTPVTTSPPQNRRSP
jgi:hypothetical protein